MARGNRLFLIYITAGGLRLARELKESLFPEAELARFKKGLAGSIWDEAGAIAFIGATGIAVRAIAPFIKSKTEDPAIIAIDEKGENIISLLSGHAGGANALSKKIAAFTKGNPVISTATDLHSLYAIDLFAAENELLMENPEILPKVSAGHIEKGRLTVYSDLNNPGLPEDYERATIPSGADAVISNRLYNSDALFLRPGNLVLGMGLNSGTGLDEIESAVKDFLINGGFSPLSLNLIATHEKKLCEEGLKAFALRHGIRLAGFTSEELNSVSGVKKSDAAMRALGAQAVAEPAAILASGRKDLLIRKKKTGNLTLALAQKNSNRLFVIGTGPGGLSHMTPHAMAAIRESAVVIGYKSYLDQIAPLLDGKEIISSAMTQEVDRAKMAVSLALEGKKVSVISGGDPGIYGMAGLIFDVVESMGADVDVDVIPGISALNACASKLGAPLMHDFAAISLSDRLTPWEQIEERLSAAARADFVIVLYNPKSKGRAKQIERAREIISAHRAPNTLVGIVRGAMRDGEEVTITTLASMLSQNIDMHSTVIIGNSNTRRLGRHMVTPRGYERKYEL